jgi:DNA-binding MarR family transcriptional regulator
MHNQLHTLITQLTNYYRNANEKLLNEVGIPPGQAQILSFLWFRDGVSQAELVRDSKVSAPTVNLLVTKLENGKFIRCKQCKNDQRIKLVYLTQKGKNIRDKTISQWNKLESHVLEDFSDTEKVLVLMLLEKIRNNLKKVLS